MLQQFKNKFPLDDQKWDDYATFFKRIEVPAKTILLNEDEISKKVFSK